MRFKDIPSRLQAVTVEYQRLSRGFLQVSSCFGSIPVGSRGISGVSTAFLGFSRSIGGISVCFRDVKGVFQNVSGEFKRVSGVFQFFQLRALVSGLLQKVSGHSRGFQGVRDRSSAFRRILEMFPAPWDPQETLRNPSETSIKLYDENSSNPPNN